MLDRLKATSLHRECSVHVEDHCHVWRRYNDEAFRNRRAWGRWQGNDGRSVLGYNSGVAWSEMIAARKRKNVTQRRDKGCRGVKAVRGADRGAMAALQSRRKKICRVCDEKAGCFIANQEACSQRRMLSDPKKFCPADPPRW